MANMAQALVVLRNRPVSGASPGVYRVTDGFNLLQVGNDFGTAEDTTNDDGSRQGRRVVQFGGPNDLYALQRGVVYKYDEPSGDWNAVHSILNFKTTAATMVNHGLLIGYENGVPTLYAMAQNTSNQVAVASSTDGSTWVARASSGGVAELAGYTNAIRFRDRICVGRSAETGTSVVMIYDTTNNSWVTYNHTGGPSTTPAPELHVWQNRLFSIAYVSNDAFRLRELVGGSFVTVVDILDTGFTLMGTVGDWNGAGCTIFTDPSTGDMIVFVVACLVLNGAVGTRAFRLTPSGGSFSVNEITDDVMATVLKPGGADASREMGWYVYREANGSVHLWVHTQDVSGGSPSGFFYYVPWNGVSAVIGEPAGTLQTLSPFANTEYTFPRTVQGGGEMIWTLNQPRLFMRDIAGPEVDKKTLRFGINGDGVSTYSVRFKYSPYSDFPNSFATLIPGTVSGAGAPTNDASQVDGVVADGSTYTVEWNAPLNGISSGAFYGIKAVPAA